MSPAASNSEARKRKLAIVPDALVLIHDFESAVLAERDLLRPLSPFDHARRDNAVDALLIAMGESPLYGGRS